MSEFLSRLPEEFQKDISTAIEILKDAGCKEIFIFGSLVTGTYHEDSDIDIAIKGCLPENFFALLGNY